MSYSYAQAMGSLLILIIAAVPALAQPPDTLRIAPCRLAPLSEKLDVSPNVRWAVHGFDTLALYRAVDPEAMKELAAIGDSIALEPLPDFPLVVLGLAHDVARAKYSSDFFIRQVCAYYNDYDYDCEYDFDVERLSRAMEITKRLGVLVDRSILVMAPRSGSDLDSLPVLITLTPQRNGDVDTLRILDGFEMMPAHNDDGRRVAVVVREEISLWEEHPDSAAIARWIAESRIGDATVYRLPLRARIRDSFARRWNESIDRIHDLLYDSEDGRYIGEAEELYALLDSLGADMSIDRRAIDKMVITLHCKPGVWLCTPYTEEACIRGFEFDDAARWNEFADSIRSIHSRYMALPDRIYAIADGNDLHALLVFPADRSRSTPIVVTREEMNAYPGMSGTDWYERLMRSIRQEECWAERMEGY